MANSNQSPSSGRQQGRQQSSELGKTSSASAQQGAQGGQRSGQQAAWQSPSTAPQSSGAGQPHHGAWPTAGSYFGALGGPFSMMRRISEDMDNLFESFGF